MKYLFTLLFVLIIAISACTPPSTELVGQAIAPPKTKGVVIVYFDMNDDGVITEGVDKKVEVTPDEFGYYTISSAGMPGRVNIIIPESTKAIRAKEEDADLEIYSPSGRVIVEPGVHLSGDSVYIDAEGSIILGEKVRIRSKDNYVSLLARGERGNIELGEGSKLSGSFVDLTTDGGRIRGNNVDIKAINLYVNSGSDLSLIFSDIKLIDNGFANLNGELSPESNYAIDLQGTVFTGKDYMVIGTGSPVNREGTEFRGKPSYISFE